MKYFITFFLFTSIITSQQTEITSTFYSIISGYAMYYQMQDRTAYGNSDPIYLSYSKTWHRLQTFEVITSISFGVQTALINFNEPVKIPPDILLLGAIRWIVRDGTYNLLNGNNFFHQSNETTAQFEQFGTPLIKLLFLAFILIFKYYLIELI